MAYFTTAQHNQILADPASITAIYASERARFKADLGANFTAEIEEMKQLAFCGLMAFDLKPYQQSNAVTMADLLAAPGLDCDNYVILTWRLFLLLVPSPTIRFMALGWDGGSIGNHAQIFASKALDAEGFGGGNWFVDPTIGVVMAAHDFNTVARGIGVNTAYLHDFYWRTGSVTDWLHQAVVDSLAQGLYRPSDLLYVFDNLDDYIAPPPIHTWHTPRSLVVDPYAPGPANPQGVTRAGSSRRSLYFGV